MIEWLARNEPCVFLLLFLFFNYIHFLLLSTLNYVLMVFIIFNLFYSKLGSFHFLSTSSSSCYCVCDLFWLTWQLSALTREHKSDEILWIIKDSLQFFSNNGKSFHFTYHVGIICWSYITTMLYKRCWSMTLCYYCFGLIIGRLEELWEKKLSL